jgi:hypothetical protein
MSFDLTTPALLFSTSALLLLAYTNRFLGIANTIRKLHSDHKEDPSEIFLLEITNLSRRIRLIREMQTLSALSILLCTLCMGTLFVGWVQFGKVIFGTSLVVMALSLVLSIIEIRMSDRALELHLRDIQNI